MANGSNQSPINVPQVDPGEPHVTMAPLIDVVFLLLIFFVVTTVFPENRGLMVEKPASEFSEPLVMKKMIFLLTETGSVFFKNKTVTIEDVQRLVKEQLTAAPDSAVLLQIDRRATTESLIKLMDACKLGGAERVGIATKPNEQKQ
jgi:biopolymer transport protein ExbD